MFNTFRYIFISLCFRANNNFLYYSNIVFGISFASLDWFFSGISKVMSGNCATYFCWSKRKYLYKMLYDIPCYCFRWYFVYYSCICVGICLL